ncbi:restriction endonuclease subunit S, partial [candidate division Kazan bacterium]
GIKRQELLSLQIPLPPLEEQWGIAEVLSTVDRAIEAADCLIGRLKRFKKALMQELLTKGIGHEEFKDTPIGKIPKEWELSHLVNIAKIFDCKHRTPKYYSHGFPVLLPRNVREGYIDLKEAPRTSYEEYLDLTEKYKPQKYDIIYTRNAKVGIAGIVLTEEPFALGQDLVAIRATEKINPKFLLYVLNSNIIRIQLLRAQTGSTFKRINLGLIKKFLIPLPSYQEQQKIADILWSIDEWIQAEEQRKEKLERLMRGLMNILLTGRVRVRVERVS